MRVLVTGATGFLGQEAVRALSADGHDVWAAGETAASVAAKLEGVVGPGRMIGFDLADPADVMQAVAAVDPQAVLHLGARSEVALSFDNYLGVSQVNYVGTVALVEAFQRRASDPRLFLMASTMETYGRAIGPGETAAVGTPQLPMAPYAVAKVACERYLDYMWHAYGTPSLVLRQTNTYGRHDNDFFVMERVITQMLAGGAVRLGPFWPERNFLYVDDLVDLYRRAMADPEGAASVRVATLGPPNALSIGALVELVAGVLGWDGDVEWLTQQVRPGEVDRLDSETTPLLTLALGWEPTTGLEDGVALTARKWGWGG